MTPAYYAGVISYLYPAMQGGLNPMQPQLPQGVTCFNGNGTPLAERIICQYVASVTHGKDNQVTISPDTAYPCPIISGIAYSSPVISGIIQGNSSHEITPETNITPCGHGCSPDHYAAWISVQEQKMQVNACRDALRPVQWVHPIYQTSPVCQRAISTAAATSACEYRYRARVHHDANNYYSVTVVSEDAYAYATLCGYIKGSVASTEIAQGVAEVCLIGRTMQVLASNGQPKYDIDIHYQFIPETWCFIEGVPLPWLFRSQSMM